MFAVESNVIVIGPSVLVTKSTAVPKLMAVPLTVPTIPDAFKLPFLKAITTLLELESNVIAVK